MTYLVSSGTLNLNSSNQVLQQYREPRCDRTSAVSSMDSLLWVAVTPMIIGNAAFLGVIAKLSHHQGPYTHTHTHTHTHVRARLLQSDCSGIAWDGITDWCGGAIDMLLARHV